MGCFGGNNSTRLLDFTTSCRCAPCTVTNAETPRARIASRLGAPLYKLTQSRLHVLITHGFLRSLARLDLAESRVGRFDPGAPDETGELADPA